MSAPTLRPVARPDLPTRRPSLLQVGAPAALWALLAGLVVVGLPVVVVWASDGRSGADALDAVRTAGQVWSLSHLGPLGLDAGRLSVVPLGLLAVPLAVLVRAGGAAARQYEVTDLRDARRLAAAVAGPYALGAAAVAALSASSQVRPSLLGALVGASTVALLGAGTGIVRAAGLGGALPGVVPGPLRRLLAPAGAAVLALLAAGALLAGLQLLLHASRAAELARASGPGAVGGVALLLLGVALVPNAVVWGAAWWAGPGFAVGVGTTVGPLAHDLGPVPALPLLAALPAGPLPVAVGVLALLVPLAAGALAGLLLRRRGSATPRRDALLCGPLAGLAVGLLAWLSGGAAGGERLAVVGPSAWQAALAVTVEVGVGALLLVLLADRRDARSPHAA